MGRRRRRNRSVGSVAEAAPWSVGASQTQPESPQRAQRVDRVDRLKNRKWETDVFGSGFWALREVNANSCALPPFHYRRAGSASVHASQPALLGEIRSLEWGCQPPALERPDQIAPQAQLLVFVAHGLFCFFPLTAGRATGFTPPSSDAPGIAPVATASAVDTAMAAARDATRKCPT
jgi:hypothetical protein